MSYTVRMAPEAERVLAKLPEKSAAAVVEFVLGDLSANPHRCGGSLRRELTGYHRAVRGSYRIIYRIDDDAGAIDVVRIEHREHVYRKR